MYAVHLLVKNARIKSSPIVSKTMTDNELGTLERALNA